MGCLQPQCPHTHIHISVGGMIHKQSRSIDRLKQTETDIGQTNYKNIQKVQGVEVEKQRKEERREERERADDSASLQQLHLYYCIFVTTLHLEDLQATRCLLATSRGGRSSRGSRGGGGSGGGGGG